MTRRKLAELTSGIGALVLGIGLGALVSTWVAGAAGFITVAGMTVHAFGMWDKHRLETQSEADSGRLTVVLYWVCWLLLAGVLVYLIM